MRIFAIFSELKMATSYNNFPNQIFAQALGDELFTYRFEGSAVLAKLTEGHSPETHPQYYTRHCWDVSKVECYIISRHTPQSVRSYKTTYLF
jgi:hypothetical protein